VNSRRVCSQSSFETSARREQAGDKATFDTLLCSRFYDFAPILRLE
jgi:hypothetical protein